MKIDVDNDEEINWDDFSTYMLLQSKGGREDCSNTKLFETTKVTTTGRNPIHKEMIVKIQYLSHTKRFMSVCREGTVCYWNDSLKLQRKYLNAGQIQSELKRKSDAYHFDGTEYRWINDALYIESIQKVVMASDDHQISIYGIVD
jgi:hypothetical protein